jgi:ABC-2 type transport system permease protein
MSARDPLLPNALIVARREYLERVRSRLFVGSTIVLALVAVLVALGPLAIRMLDRTTVTTIAVVTVEPTLTARTITSIDGVLNLPPTGVEPASRQRRFDIVAGTSSDTATADVDAGRIDGALLVVRDASGGLHFTFYTRAPAGSQQVQLVGFGALAAAILDWQAALPHDATNVFRPPEFVPQSAVAASEGGRPIDAQEAASRAFLGIAFVVLIFITLVIYGMWVATGVATEKGSRVMELMISAASPVQLLVGKVVGLGAAGLTQYAAIVLPALAVLLVQDRLAELLLGPSGTAQGPLVGLTIPLLLAFLGCFVLGFSFYALVYAAAGSIANRPEDLQVVALPLSLLSMVGYLLAIGALGGSNGSAVVLASYMPLWSPFVMLARVMVGRVEPWELALAAGLLVAAIGGALWLAVRVYSAGVLLYGQRPGLRAFIAAARSPR